MSKEKYSKQKDVKFVSPVFDSNPITDNTRTDPETGAPQPLIDEVTQAKRWVDENEL